MWGRGSPEGPGHSCLKEASSLTGSQTRSLRPKLVLHAPALAFGGRPTGFPGPPSGHRCAGAEGPVPRVAPALTGPTTPGACTSRLTCSCPTAPASARSNPGPCQGAGQVGLRRARFGADRFPLHTPAIIAQPGHSCSGHRSVMDGASVDPKLRVAASALALHPVSQAHADSH